MTRALPAPAHGTRARYKLRRSPCRCPACRAANARYVRRWRTGTGTYWTEPRLWPDARG